MTGGRPRRAADGPDPPALPRRRAGALDALRGRRPARAGHRGRPVGLRRVFARRTLARGGGGEPGRGQRDLHDRRRACSAPRRARSSAAGGLRPVPRRGRRRGHPRRGHGVQAVGWRRRRRPPRGPAAWRCTVAEFAELRRCDDAALARRRAAAAAELAGPGAGRPRAGSMPTAWPTAATSPSPPCEAATRPRPAIALGPGRAVVEPPGTGARSTAAVVRALTARRAASVLVAHRRGPRLHRGGVVCRPRRGGAGRAARRGRRARGAAYRCGATPSSTPPGTGYARIVHQQLDDCRGRQPRARGADGSTAR